jgi:class 3 adenylate cyclase
METIDRTSWPSVGERLAGGRYLLTGVLGRGTRKSVFRARDSRLDRDVAIAIPSAVPPGVQATHERVHQEARLMARLGDHPNIVTILDVGEEEGRPYIVSQLMEGGSLQSLLERSPAHRLPAEEAIRVTEGVLRALRHSHDRGILHADVKPANIWLSGTGTAKLGDFGLASAPIEPAVRSEALSGTIAYLAPERATGQADPRSDLYSLGCVLFEMLWGRRPFAGDDPAAVIAAHIGEAPSPPGDPSVPGPLRAFTLRLLAKAPDDRPATAADALDLLRDISTVTAVPAPEAPGSDDLRWGRFVGRGEQLEQLSSFVDEALAGRGLLVLIGGEPGIGKTRLTDEVATYARNKGAIVSVGRCYETEVTHPYGPIVEALRWLLQTLDPSRLTAALGAGAADVSKLVPSASILAADAAPLPSADPEQERFRLFEHVSSFLIHASESRPLVLVLEDLHWADSATLQLVLHLTRRLPAGRLLVLGTYRDEGIDRRHPLAATMADLRRERSWHRVLVRGFSPDEVLELLNTITGADLGGAGAVLATALFRETEGNPFFIEEILRHLIETDALLRREDQWIIDETAIAELEIPQGVREVIGRRLSRLSDACNKALAAAAVLGRDFEFDVLDAMGVLPGDDLLQAIEEALQARIIAEPLSTARGMRRAPTYVYAHALVRQTLYEELSLPRKQGLHLKAARAIEAVRADYLDAYLSALAGHYRLAGAAAPGGQGVDYSLRAADAALAIYAWEEAAIQLEAALELEEELGAPPQRRAELNERLGDLMLANGLDAQRGVNRLHTAMQLFEELGQHEEVARLHTRVGRELASVWAIKNLPHALEHLEAAESGLLPSVFSRARVVELYAGLASARMAQLRVAEGLESSARALEAAQELGDERASADGTVLHGWLSFCAGRISEGLSLLERAWEKADAMGFQHEAYTAALFRGRAAAYLRDPRDAQEWFQRELTRRGSVHGPRPRRFLAGELVASYGMTGEIERARRLLGEPGPGTPPEAQLAFLTGDWSRARDLWSELRERTHGSGDRWGEWTVADSLGRMAVFAGDTAEAEEHFARALELVREAPPFELAVRANLVLLHSEAGRALHALVHMDRCRELLPPGTPARGLHGLLLLAEGAYAVVEERHTEADRFFEDALAVFRRYELPWDEADALHCWGRALIERGQRSRGLDLLDTALRLYRTHGAAGPWIEGVLVDRLRAQGLDGRAVTASIDSVAREAGAERPDLHPFAAPDGTITILFTDIQDSTAMNLALGNAGWVEALRDHNAIVRARVRDHGGFVVKSRGDGFMVVFSDPARAVRCAVEVQQALRTYNRSRAADPLLVRIGIHSGEAIPDEGDFFGTDVNLAARVAGSAGGAQILVSDRVRELVASGGFEFCDEQDLLLQGIGLPQRVFGVRWD